MIIESLSEIRENVSHWLGELSNWLGKGRTSIRNMLKYPRIGVLTNLSIIKVACTSGRKCLYSLVNYFKEISSTFS